MLAISNVQKKRSKKSNEPATILAIEDASRDRTSTLADWTTEIDVSENLSPERRLQVYDCDQLNLFGDLENEEERPEEFQDGGHYAADIGEIIKNKK